ncbi:hypothetical protein M8C21_022358 [Ambrosia artemisiifolia]|uniref:Uncharacterized protein n=1 Tax=Ambrosia artemisiifolia TaxID=4212 RepID=A0AAD5C5X7_AMBAR|nr:hypothetical protein M8C21_022358 [Ambrosia artemisiifolia]
MGMGLIPTGDIGSVVTGASEVTILFSSGPGRASLALRHIDFIFQKICTWSILFIQKFNGFSCTVLVTMSTDPACTAWAKVGAILVVVGEVLLVDDAWLLSGHHYRNCLPHVLSAVVDLGGNFAASAMKAELHTLQK